MTSLDDLLKEGRIESIEADVTVAEDKLEEAKRHLASAAAIADDDLKRLRASLERNREILEKLAR